MEVSMEPHRVVSRDEWIRERKALLAREKAFTRARDELGAERRALPWVKIEKGYVFDTPGGKRSLAELFDGKSQLLVYHFMLGPGWKEGCPSCSYLADHFDGAVTHLGQRDVTFVVVSRAPLAEIEAFKRRMGWRFNWVSSFGSDFNFDYHVSFPAGQVGSEVDYNYEKQDAGSDEMPGASVFYKDASGQVFHTYSAYARGLDILVGTYNFLDLTPKGRDEQDLPWSMAWVRHHDRYDESHARCCA
jgi:predicted dithiol-disulfide oxidoreductase (DUF899 family)